MNSINKAFEKFEKKHNLTEFYGQNMGIMIPVKEIEQLKSEIQEIVDKNFIERKKIEDRIIKYDKALNKLNKQAEYLKESVFDGNKKAIQKLNSIRMALFGVESSKKELKSLLEVDEK